MCLDSRSGGRTLGLERTAPLLGACQRGAVDDFLKKVEGMPPMPALRQPVAGHGGMGASTAPPASTSAPANSQDLFGNLSKLIESHSAGPLSDSEFSAAKRGLGLN